jgi:hypothetical protein
MNSLQNVLEVAATKDPRWSSVSRLTVPTDRSAKELVVGLQQQMVLTCVALLKYPG